MKKWLIFGAVLVLIVTGITIVVYKSSGDLKTHWEPNSKLEIQLGFDTDGSPVWGWYTEPETKVWYRYNNSGDLGTWDKVSCSLSLGDSMAMDTVKINLTAKENEKEVLTIAGDFVSKMPCTFVIIGTSSTNGQNDTITIKTGHNKINYKGKLFSCVEK